jgi:hypothetical protein
MDIMMTRPQTQIPLSKTDQYHLLNVWNEYFMVCKKISKNAQDRATGKAGRETAWTLDTLDQDMYLCHTEEEVGGVGGER